MTKKEKIIISLAVLFLLLVLYLILTAKPVRDNELADNNTNISSVNELDQNYKKQASLAADNYLKLVENKNFTAEEVKGIKDSLLELKVPAALKDLHINFVLALTKLEDYLTTGKESAREESLKLFNQLKANYDWLN